VVSAAGGWRAGRVSYRPEFGGNGGLLCGCGCGAGDGEADGLVAEVRGEVRAAAGGFDVTGGDLGMAGYRLWLPAPGKPGNSPLVSGRDRNGGPSMLFRQARQPQR